MLSCAAVARNLGRVPLEKDSISERAKVEVGA